MATKAQTSGANISSRNYRAITRPNQSNLFGQKQTSIITRSQTSMMMAETPKQYLLAQDQFISPTKHGRQMGAQVLAKKNKMKIADSGAISTRSSNGKTFFSSYIGAQAGKSNQPSAQTSASNSFINKSRNMVRANSNSTNIVPAHHSQLSAHHPNNQMAGVTGHIGPNLTMSMSHIDMQQERLPNNGTPQRSGVNSIPQSGHKRKNAVSQLAHYNLTKVLGPQHQNKLVSPDVTQKLLKNQLSLDLKQLNKMNQMTKRGTGVIKPKQTRNVELATSAQLSATRSYNTTKEVLNPIPQVQSQQQLAQYDYNLRSMSYKRSVKNKEKLRSRQPSMTQMQLHDLRPNEVEEISERQLYKQALAKMNMQVKQNKKKFQQTELLNNIHNNFTMKNKKSEAQYQQILHQRQQSNLISPKPKKGGSDVNSPSTKKAARVSYNAMNKSEKPHLMDSVQKSVHKKKASFQGKLNDQVMSNMDVDATDCTYNTFSNGGYQTSLGHHYNSSMLSAEGAIGKPNKQQTTINSLAGQNAMMSHPTQDNEFQKLANSSLGFNQSGNPSTKPAKAQKTKFIKQKALAQNVAQNQEQLYHQLQMLHHKSEQNRHRQSLAEKQVMQIINEVNHKVGGDVQQPAQKTSKRADQPSQLQMNQQQQSQTSLANRKPDKNGDRRQMIPIPDKVIKQARDKLGGKSLQQLSQQAASVSGYLNNSNHMKSQQQVIEKKKTSRKQASNQVKKQVSADIIDAADPNQIELVGVYKFTRNQQANTRRRDQVDVPPQINSYPISSERLCIDDEYQTINPSAMRKDEQSMVYQQFTDDADIKDEHKTIQESANYQSTKQNRNVRKRSGKSASEIRQKIEERGINSARKRDTYKEEEQQQVGETRKAQHRSINDAKLFDFSKNKRRETSCPAPQFQSLATQKLFKEADLLVLENRSTSQVRSFKIFNEQEVFPSNKMRPELLQPIDQEDKHDECDYETEPEHVYKAQELMLEDLCDSIQFYVENQPLDLINNLRTRYRQ